MTTTPTTTEAPQVLPDETQAAPERPTGLATAGVRATNTRNMPADASIAGGVPRQGQPVTTTDKSQFQVNTSAVKNGMSVEEIIAFIMKDQGLSEEDAIKYAVNEKALVTR